MSDNNTLNMDDITEILAHLVRTYSDYMDKWGDSDRPVNVNDVASAYGLMSFDLINLLHLINGNVAQVIANTEALGDVGSISVKQMADYQSDSEEQVADYQAEGSKAKDPLEWN